MDNSWQARVRRVEVWLDASPTELVALAILLGGAVMLALFLVRGSAEVSALVPGGTDELVPTRAPATVVVHVVGAVGHPGVVELAEGARVADALEAAGGAAVDAALDGLNLARPVTDGEQLHVPRIGHAAAGPTGVAATAGPWTADGLLDLNRAAAADLQELPGIGPVLAERIVSWREQHGPFEDVGQLREVSGIGEKTFQSLSSLVAV